MIMFNPQDMITVFASAMAELTGKFILCKYCGHKVSVSAYSGNLFSKNGEWESGIEVSCTNPFCPHKEHGDERSSDEVVGIQFTDSIKQDQYFGLLNKQYVLQMLNKYNKEEFKLITKRKGQKQHYCRDCGKEILQGEKVHSYTETGCSVRGRHFSNAYYLCENCFPTLGTKLYINPLELMK